MKASELFGKYPKTPDFDHSNYPLFKRIPAVPSTLSNQGLTVSLNGNEIFIKNEHESPAKSQISLQAVQFFFQNSILNRKINKKANKYLLCLYIFNKVFVMSRILHHATIALYSTIMPFLRF